MRELLSRRWPPFAVAAVVVAVVCIAVARLPDPFVEQLENERVLSTTQAGWAYRLLALAAVAQAVYGGFAVFRAERVQRARDRDPKTAAMPRVRLVAVLARNAAAMVCLTLVYGVAALYVTGQRGGFWLFPVLAIAQGVWYYREVGQIARWLTFHEDPQPERDIDEWRREPADYVPPLVRGLKPVAAGSSSEA